MKQSFSLVALAAAIAAMARLALSQPAPAGTLTPSFTKITAGEIVTDQAEFFNASWGDFDNDGWPDLFVPNEGGRNLLYHNEGNGVFTKITNNIIAQEGGSSEAAAWADYDNDGLLDLLVVNLPFAGARGLRNFLYHNDGNGKFTKVTSGPIVTDVSPESGFSGCAWADYDNDGFLDLIIQVVDAHVNGASGHPYLYHNNGDGTFERVQSDSSILTDRGFDEVFAWGDYDRDGLLDLFIAQGGGWDIYFAGLPHPHNYLYHNDGTTNSWLGVKLIGTVSNRSAIGAKVRVKAFYRGADRWQLREISGGDGSGNQQPLEAHFGLGDATRADVVRVEWPSGQVQELHGLEGRQLLTIVEPSQLTATLQGADVQLHLKGGRGMQYAIQGSTDLVTWSEMAGLQTTITNAAGSTDFPLASSGDRSVQFYRSIQIGGAAALTP